ncbi:antibiotic biosynthesis monooxygenase|uniref:Heme-degrading monooxygenase HmoA n=1 Tax=Dendrosporobacter quercicolus TaxID=146817 RepID=A0A1G9XG80_9FIRM|nr:antibiotic biosynthesis monooxygenase [Dendrosporobacter quercicolus]NSL49673.1 antibiotic biosynthesis monooxygenase [Dendrosporobacter quercicolus DSM 1736]SDM95819.1 Heme-degrading monooxygenase HmoA [Dendrosporobacter quercicolus]
MVAVIFEVTPFKAGKAEYLRLAAGLREHLVKMPGFISAERFQSLAHPEKLLSISFWESEAAAERWRKFEPHYFAQDKGRDQLFKNYRIRVGDVIRDDELTEAAER